MKLLASKEYNKYIINELKLFKKNKYIENNGEKSVTNKTIEILIYLLGYLKDNSFDVESLNEFSENLMIFISSIFS